MKSELSKTRHPNEKYFFDIPVFRCDFDTWAKDQDDKRNKLARTLSKDREPTEREIDFAEKWLRPEWSAYYYSEMVGMIRLFAINLQIRAELWFVKEKISRNLKRKRWHLANIKIFEYWVHANDKNSEIFEWVLARLKKENQEWILKNRYIDFEAFEHSGEYIDYIELADFSSQVTQGHD